MQFTFQPMRQLQPLWLGALLLTVLSGCAGSTKTAGDITSRFNDDLFPNFQQYQLEQPEQIFYLGEEAKAFVDLSKSKQQTDSQNMRRLVNKIFDRAELGLTYLNNANSVADTTFLNQQANCLSLSIMTYALADYAGYDAEFFEVDIPEYWTRRDGFSLLNGHINLKIETNELTSSRMITDFVNVDFDPQDMRKHFKRRAIGKTRIVAMFYNNIGAEALIGKEFDKAYAYLRRALLTDSTLSDAWVNLGILYRMHDAYSDASNAYKMALTLDTENLTAWENMAVLYNYSGDKETAANIIQMVKRRRAENPFYHFILGEQALDAGKLEDALVFYRRAYKLDGKRHEVLFGLGKTYYELGALTKAERFLSLAERYANDDVAHRYRGKLSFIHTANN